MVFTVEKNLEFVNATECHICGNTFTNTKKVRDHRHMGTYPGYAHNRCNLKYKIDHRRRAMVDMVDLLLLEHK